MGSRANLCSPKPTPSPAWLCLEQGRQQPQHPGSAGEPTPYRGIVELLRLEKPSKIIRSNRHPNTSTPAKPCPEPPVGKRPSISCNLQPWPEPGRAMLDPQRGRCRTPVQAMPDPQRCPRSRRKLGRAQAPQDLGFALHPNTSATCLCPAKGPVTGLWESKGIKAFP